MKITSYKTDNLNRIVGKKLNPCFSEYIGSYKGVGFIVNGDIHQVCDVGDHYCGFDSLEKIMPNFDNYVRFGYDKKSFNIWKKASNIKDLQTVYELVYYLLFIYPDVQKIDVDVFGDDSKAIRITTNREGIIEDKNKYLLELREYIEEYKEELYEKEQEEKMNNRFISKVKRLVCGR